MKIENAIDKLAVAVSKARIPKAGIKSKYLFWMFSDMHASGWDSSPVEKQYWLEQGWIKK